MIYSISYGPWINPILIVSKKGEMTVIYNENNKLISSKSVTRWRMYIDYKKLNQATKNDHFQLPFIDQMLERLVRQKYYCFLDGYSSYNQIVVHHQNHEKTTFNCLLGIFAYRKIPFGLYNASTRFQRCMLAIFSNLVEKKH